MTNNLNKFGLYGKLAGEKKTCHAIGINSFRRERKAGQLKIWQDLKTDLYRFKQADISVSKWPK